MTVTYHTGNNLPLLCIILAEKLSWLYTVRHMHTWDGTYLANDNTSITWDRNLSHGYFQLDDDSEPTGTIQPTLTVQATNPALKPNVFSKQCVGTSTKSRINKL